MRKLIEGFVEVMGATERRILARIEPLEKRQPEPPPNIAEIARQAAYLIPPPVAGKDGRDGQDAPIPDLEQIAAKAAALVPVPKDGRDGKDASAPDIDAIALLAAELVPRPIDGKDGANGLTVIGDRGEAGPVGPQGPPGPPGPSGEKGMDGIAGRDGLPGRDGQNGINGETGAKGLDGKDGADGLGMDDMEVLFDGERTLTLKFMRGDRVKSFEAVFPVDIYRGVWVDHKTYERGDGATWGGSLWHCNRTTTAKPGDGSKDWTLKAKRGSDGRDGKSPDVAPVVKLERSHA